MAAAAGLTAGVAILVRPAMLMFLPLAALWLAVHRRPALAAALVVTSLAVIAPWTVRNVRVYGTFVLIASEGGVTFWTGNHPLARGEGDLAANPDIKAAEIAFRARAPGTDRGGARAALLSRRAGLHRARIRSGGSACSRGRRSTRSSRSARRIRYTRRDTWCLSLASYLLLLPFAVAGCARARWRRAPARGAVLLLAASAVVAGLVFFPQERFRIPVIDPALIVLRGRRLRGARDPGAERAPA